MPKPQRSLGRRLRDLRIEAGLSQSELGKRVGILKPTLSRYENDHVLPSLKMIGRLAVGLSISEAELLPDEPEADQHFLHQLKVRGISIDSVEDAEVLADAVAEVIHASRKLHA